MNGRQAWFVRLAAALVLLTGLVPPWRLTVREALPENVTPHTFYAEHEVAVGYAPVFTPPRDASAGTALAGSARVDAGLLLVEWATVLGGAALAVSAFRASARPGRPGGLAGTL